MDRNDAELKALLLSTLPPEQPSPALRAAVLARAPKPRFGGVSDRMWRWWGAGWAAAACAGVLLGGVLQVEAPQDELLAVVEPYDALFALGLEDQS